MSEQSSEFLKPRTIAEVAKDHLKSADFGVHKDTYEGGREKRSHESLLELAGDYFDLVSKYDRNLSTNPNESGFRALNDRTLSDQQREELLEDFVGEQKTWFDRLYDPQYGGGIYGDDWINATVQEGVLAFAEPYGDNASVREYDGRLMSWVVELRANKGVVVNYPTPDKFAAKSVREAISAAVDMGRMDLAAELIGWIDERWEELSKKVDERTEEPKEKYKLARDRVFRLAQEVSLGYFGIVSANESKVSVAKKADMIGFVLKYTPHFYGFDTAMYEMTFLSAKELANVSIEDRNRMLNYRKELHARLEEVRGLDSIGASVVRTAGSAAAVTEGVMGKFAQTSFGSRLINMLNRNGGGEKAKNDEKRKNDFDGTSDDTVLDKAANRVGDRVFEDGELLEDWQQTFETLDGKPRRMTLDELKKGKK